MLCFVEPMLLRCTNICENRVIKWLFVSSCVFFKQQNVGHYQNVQWVLPECIMGTTHVNIRNPIYTDVGIFGV